MSECVVKPSWADDTLAALTKPAQMNVLNYCILFMFPHYLIATFLMRFIKWIGMMVLSVTCQSRVKFSVLFQSHFSWCHWNMKCGLNKDGKCLPMTCNGLWMTSHFQVDDGLGQSTETSSCFSMKSIRAAAPQLLYSQNSLSESESLSLKSPGNIHMHLVFSMNALRTHEARDHVLQGIT